MTHAHRIVSLGFAGAAAVLGALPAAAATPSDHPVQGWSAMIGTSPAALLDDIHDMPVSALAIDDQPYCAADAEIASTLRHDFDERPIDATGVQGTQLWGSQQLGTWTLVAPRADETSCIIASGIGFTDDRDSDAYFTVAGL